jgi:drug/metabolite transporter (DMT)-like permease
LAAVAETSLAAGLWGTSFPVISIAINEGLDPVVFVFLRFVLAAPLMIMVAFFLRRRMRKLLADKAVWAIALLNTIGFLCQFIGQKYTAASVAALLVNLSVVFAAIGGVVFLRERLGPFKLTGVALALVGTLLLASKGDLSGFGKGEVFGDGLYLIAALSWAGYIVYAKKKTVESDWDPVALATCIVVVTAVLLVPFVFLSRLSLPPSPTSWGAVIYTAIFNTAIPFVLYQSGLRQLTAAGSAVVLMLEIVVALIISVAFLGETFTLISLLGAVAVLASILLVSGAEAGGKSLSVGQNDGRPVRVQN